MIFHHAIGLKNIRANLIAPRYLLFSIVQGFELLLLLSKHSIVEPSPEHLHRHVAIAMLGTLVLALRDDTGRNMGDADGRVRNVDVLASFAARPVSIDAEILLIDFDFHLFVDLGKNKDRRERGVSPLRCVEG